ncbi:hypothetical protein Ciccas_003171 [Cichlidogyrus casuarinus]|uniref:HTH CENPB-type domain-containing protein n=1 Tax=Cichlidogyrus casuarinus TaxID=1844966 RepID=A0ABD2QF27_9PLAT
MICSAFIFCFVVICWWPIAHAAQNEIAGHLTIHFRVSSPDPIHCQFDDKRDCTTLKFCLMLRNECDWDDTSLITEQDIRTISGNKSFQILHDFRFFESEQVLLKAELERRWSKKPIEKLSSHKLYLSEHVITQTDHEMLRLNGLDIQIKVNISLSCSKNFYGPLCQRKCVPMKGATCDEEGILQCTDQYCALTCNNLNLASIRGPMTNPRSLSDQTSLICLNEGVCHQNEENGFWACICPFSFYGRMCENYRFMLTHILLAILILLAVILVPIVIVCLKQRVARKQELRRQKLKQLLDHVKMTDDGHSIHSFGSKKHLTLASVISAEIINKNYQESNIDDDDYEQLLAKREEILHNWYSGMAPETNIILKRPQREHDSPLSSSISTQHSSNVKRRKSDLNLKKRQELIAFHELHPSMSHEEIGAKYGIHPTAAMRIVSRKEEIQEAVECGYSKKRRRICKSMVKDPEEEEACAELQSIAKDCGMPLTYNQLRTNALALSNDPNVKASTDWIHEFVLRYELKSTVFQYL